MELIGKLNIDISVSASHTFLQLDAFLVLFLYSALAENLLEDLPLQACRVYVAALAKYVVSS